MQDHPDDLVTPGFCTVCECHVRDSMAVAFVPTGSGPGRIVEACVAHARERAGYALAPKWLRDDIARLDALNAREGA